MIDNVHVLDVLFREGNALWRAETQHGAMLLLRALYKADAGVRAKVITLILAGPPSQFLRDENSGGADRDIFEVLAFLESENLPLPTQAQDKLARIRKRHPEWKQRKYPGMSIWVESGGGVDESVAMDDVKSLAPEDVPNRIIAFEEGWKRSRRELCEAVGMEIAHNPEWGLRVLDALKTSVQKLPQDSINPMLWGIRATLTDNTIKMEKNGVCTLLNTFRLMIENRPVPPMWSSLPSVLKHLVGKFELPIAAWNELGILLASIFETFDYERDKEEKPIEWLQRAINHPYGDLAELHLLLAQQHVNVLSKAEKPLSLEPHAERFFSRMLAHYDIGSRYGLCLLAQRSSWMEAVSPRFSDALCRVFEWTNGGEQHLVAWSGYLWSNTMSRRLVQNFETTYIPAARRHSEFARQERRGLATHVSAVFWLHPERINFLHQFANAVDSELRVDLVYGWKTHLKNAQEESIKQFFDTIVFPYWDWCAQQDFFSSDNGGNERFAFWELVPLSLGSFPAACQRAIQWPPSKINRLGLFVGDAVNEATLQYPNELTELLIALLEFDPCPQWQDKDWRASLDRLRGTGAKRFTDFEDALARKGISLDATP